MNTAKWRKLIHRLREDFPTEGVVNVRRAKMKRNFGVTRRDGKNYFIRVCSDQSWSIQVETLAHEWAHVQAIELAYTHSKLWGSVYSDIYRLVIGEQPRTNY